LTRTFSTHFAASIAASGLKWMSATIGTWHPRSRKPATMCWRFAASFTVGAVMRTISQTDGGKIEGLLDGRGSVHRVTGNHRLHADRMLATDGDIADLDNTALPPLVSVR
jgi:hypothetical protein